MGGIGERMRMNLGKNYKALKKEIFELKHLFSQFLQTQEQNRRDKSRGGHGKDSSKKKSHYDQSSHKERTHGSHHNLDYYQEPHRAHRHQSSQILKEPKVHLPPFFGKEDVEVVLTQPQSRN